MANTSTSLRRTSLYDAHIEAGAKMVPFAGWEMPIQYRGIREEHVAVRRASGMFDVSHMGQIETRGPDAARFLQRVLSNDLNALKVGGAQYSLICRPDGGIVDDVFTYRLSEQSYLTVTNASNHAKDFEWFVENADGFAVEICDRIDDYAMLAVQGPSARAALTSLSDDPLPPRFEIAERAIAGHNSLVAGTGYTGEDGVEILVDPQDASGLWKELLANGVEPVGLGARDTLRIEVCFHLYGNDMDEDRNPIEAGLGWCCKESTEFIGSDAVSEARVKGTAEKLVPFVVTGSGIARAGNSVVGGGTVTSGTFSPCLSVGIGMAYLPIEKAQPSTDFEIDVRGKLRQAQVKKKPLYRKESEDIG